MTTLFLISYYIAKYFLVYLEWVVDEWWVITYNFKTILSVDELQRVPSTGVLINLYITRSKFDFMYLFKLIFSKKLRIFEIISVDT